MVGPIHHIGVVVQSLDQAHAFFQDQLDLPCLKEEFIEDQGVRASLLDLGNALLELLEPVTTDTGIARYLANRGEGLHHVCLEVDGIETTLTDLKARGIPLVDEAPRPGLTGTIAFLHPSALHGVLVELLERSTAFRAQAEAHSERGRAGAAMTIERLDHLILAVADIDTASRAWADALGLEVESTVQPSGTHMELAFLPAGPRDPQPHSPNPAFIELVRPTSESHRVARHLAERGEGMFSVSLQVADLDAAVADLRARKIDVSDPEAGVLPDTRVARIPRATAHGVAIQLIER